MRDVNNTNTTQTWDELEKELFTEEEIAVNNLKAKLILQMIQARKEQGVTQFELQRRTGIRQPVIARMEKCTDNTRIDTILKILASLGKTLYVGDFKRNV